MAATVGCRLQGVFEQRLELGKLAFMVLNEQPLAPRHDRDAEVSWHALGDGGQPVHSNRKKEASFVSISDNKNSTMESIFIPDQFGPVFKNQMRMMFFYL